MKAYWIWLMYLIGAKTYCFVCDVTYNKWLSRKHRKCGCQLIPFTFKE